MYINRIMGLGSDRRLGRLVLYPVVLLSILFPLAAYDEILQYRPPLFFGEPHIARDGLLAVACNLDHGSTSHSYNGAGDRVPLYRLWEPCDRAHSTAPWVGKFSLTEIVLTGYQEFIKGLFVSWYMPARFLHIRHARDLLSASSQELTTSARGLGDIAWSLGWAYNYEACEVLDFIDVTIQSGVALPTSRVSCAQSTFAVPLGYQGHTGFFGIADSSLGIFDWLTIGAHIQAIGFSDTYECVPYCSDVTLACRPDAQHARPQYLVDRHPAAVVGLYTKADHLILGLSLLVGYSYMHQGARSVAGGGARLLPQTAAAYFESWSMHTIHTSIDYDWATYDTIYAPRVSITYNTVVAGTRIIPLPLFQGSIDFTFVLSF